MDQLNIPHEEAVIEGWRRKRWKRRAVFGKNLCLPGELAEPPHHPFW